MCDKATVSKNSESVSATAAAIDADEECMSGDAHNVHCDDDDLLMPGLIQTDMQEDVKQERCDTDVITQEKVRFYLT